MAKMTPTPPPRNLWRINALHNYTESKNDKVYVVTVEDLGNGSYRVCGYYGKRTGNLTMQHKVTGSLSMCEQQATELVDEKISGGYKNVEVTAYTHNVPLGVQTTLGELMHKIDTTRLVGYAAPQSPPGASTKFANQPVTFAGGGQIPTPSLNKPKKEVKPKTKKEPDPPAPTPIVNRTVRKIHL